MTSALCCETRETCPVPRRPTARPSSWPRRRPGPTSASALFCANRGTRPPPPTLPRALAINPKFAAASQQPRRGRSRARATSRRHRELPPRPGTRPERAPGPLQPRQRPVATGRPARCRRQLPAVVRTRPEVRRGPLQPGARPPPPGGPRHSPGGIPDRPRPGDLAKGLGLPFGPVDPALRTLHRAERPLAGDPERRGPARQRRRAHRVGRPLLLQEAVCNLRAVLYRSVHRRPEPGR